MVQCVLFGDIPAGFADDQTQLCLIVASAILSTLWDVYSSWIRAAQGGAWFCEKNRGFRKREVGFLFIEKGM